MGPIPNRKGCTLTYLLWFELAHLRGLDSEELRKQHLLESRAALMALDVHLAHCYDLMMLNPAGCFTKSNGDNVGSSDAKKKLEHEHESGKLQPTGFTEIHP